MKKYRVPIFFGVLFACICCVLIISNKSTSTAQIKLSEDYIEETDLLEKSQIAIEMSTLDNGTKIEYGGVNFRLYSVKVLDVISGDLIEKNQTIQILQTDLNDKAYPLLSLGTNYIVFLDKYEGDVTDNAFVINGINLGMLKEQNGLIELNDEQAREFLVLKPKGKQSLSVTNMKQLIKDSMQ